MRKETDICTLFNIGFAQNDFRVEQKIVATKIYK